MGFDSYLSKKSEFGVGQEMSSWNRENEEVKEMREPKVVSPKTPSNDLSYQMEKEKEKKMERKDEENGSSLPRHSEQRMNEMSGVVEVTKVPNLHKGPVILCIFILSQMRAHLPNMCSNEVGFNNR